MKIRTGFVSNSSSSSFCVFGTYINRDIVGFDFSSLNEDDQKVLEDANIDSFGSPDPYDESTMVGRSLTTIQDDETGAQFKSKTLKAMKQVFGNRVNCSICQEGWYDG